MTSLKEVVKITFLTWRNPEISEEEFSNHWNNVHAVALLPVMRRHGVISYSQQHTPISARETFNSIFGHSPMLDCDGVATMVFPNWESVQGFLTDPDNLKQSAEDSRFVDLTKLKMAVGNELILLDQRNESEKREI